MTRSLFRLLTQRKTLLVVGIGLALLVLYYGTIGTGGQISKSIDGCLQEGPKKQQCLDTLILGEARRGGVSHAFDVLAEIYPRDTEFALFCHGNTHQLGELAFDSFEKGEDAAISPKTSYCGFGFYHGFLEKLVYTKGDLSEARLFCEHVDEKLRGTVSGGSFACYHGIGHGVVDGTDPSRWGDAEKYIEPGLALCEKVSDIQEEKARCASGVFNALAIVLHKGEHGFSATLTDPYSICKEQKLPYVRKSCYDQMNSYIVETTDTFSDALNMAASHAEPALVTVAISSVAGYTAQEALGSTSPLTTYLGACDKLSSSLRDVCAKGFASGLIEFGNPDKEYGKAIALCVQGGERTNACLRGVIDGAQYRLGPDALEAFCAEVGRAAGASAERECRDIIERNSSSGSLL